MSDLPRVDGDASISRWMRERCVETESTGAGLRVTIDARVDPMIAGMLSGLLGTDVVLAPKSEWPDRPTWYIAWFWLFGLCWALAFTALWGVLFYLLSLLLQGALSEEATSLVALGMTSAVVVGAGLHRFVFDRTHPAETQRQVLEAGPSEFCFATSACRGPLWGLLDRMEADRGVVDTGDIERIGVEFVDHPGAGSRRQTPVVAVETGSGPLYFGHGLDEARLDEIVDLLRQQLTSPMFPDPQS